MGGFGGPAIVLGGIWRRRGLSAAVFLIALVAVVAASIGPSYYDAAATYAVRSMVSEAPASAQGIQLTQTNRAGLPPLTPAARYVAAAGRRGPGCRWSDAVRDPSDRATVRWPATARRGGARPRPAARRPARRRADRRAGRREPGSGPEPPACGDRDGAKETALVIATHDQDVADRCDRIVRLADGRLVPP